MELLLMQSDFYGPVVKAIHFFEKILEPYDCKVFHLHGTQHKSLKPLADYLESHHVDYILISAWCYNNMVFAQLLDIIQQHTGRPTVIVGGWFVNLLGLSAFQFHDRIDYIALGDGDDMLVELAQRKPIDEIDGLYCRGDKREPVYRKTDRENEVMIPGPSIVPLSGCSSRCKFCSILTNPQNFWVKSVDRIEKEIVYQKSNGIDQFYLGYDNVLLNKKRAVAYAELMKSHSCHFATTGRIDQINEEMIATLAQNGCTRLDFGVESASERLSLHINKRLTTEKIYEVGKLCREYEVLPFAFVITGLPTEDAIDREVNDRFLRESDYLLFEINRYKDYLGSEFSAQIRNFDVLALSRAYQYEACYGIFDDEDTFLRCEANYRDTVAKATRYMVDKMLAYFRGTLSEIQQITYWQSFRDATLDTSIHFDESMFKDKALYAQFSYWYRAKKFQNLQREQQANRICDKKYFIDKRVLENEGIVKEVYVNEQAVVDYMETGKREVVS